MSRSPSGFGYKPPNLPKPFAGYKPAKASKQPTPRNFGYEGMLCDAIAKRLLVSLRYEDDLQARSIAPYVVFETEASEVCLSSYQLSNPNKPHDGNEPRNFTVGKIASLQITETPFGIDPRFDRNDPKYRHRVLCRV